MTSPHEGIDMSPPLSQPDLPPLSHRGREETACGLQETLVQLEQAVAFLTRAGPRLFGIAYRILGNAADAEDVRPAPEAGATGWLAKDSEPAALARATRRACRHDRGLPLPAQWRCAADERGLRDQPAGAGVVRGG
jgi:hypothetical protein